MISKEYILLFRLIIFVLYSFTHTFYIGLLLTHTEARVNLLSTQPLEIHAHLILFTQSAHSPSDTPPASSVISGNNCLVVYCSVATLGHAQIMRDFGVVVTVVAPSVPITHSPHQPTQSLTQFPSALAAGRTRRWLPATRFGLVVCSY